MVFFFFFKQKTAYEMRISDWSSDVCSSDLLFIPDGVFDVDNIALTDFHIYGRGTLRKRAGTKGAMLSLTGDNLIEGVTLDGNWSNQLQTLPYFNNHTVQQIKGSLRSEEHTSELQSLMRISYAVFCLNIQKINKRKKHHNEHI